MFRTLGILAGGMFVGAVAMEIARRKCPKKIDTLYKGVGKMGGKVKGYGAQMQKSFSDGYKSAVA